MMRISVVTGASGGIGRAVARRLAARGDAVALLARGADGLAGAAEDVRAAGGTPLPIELDMSDFSAVDQAADQVEKELGPIDLWVNNAFSSVFARFQDIGMDEFQRTTEVTYLGYVHGTRAALTRMLPRDRGVIVQVGSALAYRGIPLQSAYCAAKHAVQGFCDSLRCELLHDNSNVKVTMVHMPALNTPQFGWVKSRLERKAQPVPPIFQPEVAAEAIYFAAHNLRREFYVGLPTVKAIVADKIAPGLLDRYLANTGFDAQQYDGYEDPNRPDNLWQPLRGDHGAHGAFDRRARSWSAQLWISEHRGWIAAAVVALGMSGLLAFLKKK